MKTLFLALALFNTANASEIICWNDHHKIYHGNGYNIQVDPISILFRESKTHDLIYIMGSCLLREKHIRHKSK